MGPYAVFADLTNAFDFVSPNGLWKILAHVAPLPPPQLCKGQHGQVKHNGSLWRSFPISNGVKPHIFYRTHLSLSRSQNFSVSLPSDI